MIKVRLTGPIAAGKTEVLNLFNQFGAATINTDQVVLELLNIPTHMDQLQLLAPDCFDHGQLNRQQLRRLFFSDHHFNRAWQHYIHPIVRMWINQHLLSVTQPYIVIEMPMVPNPGIVFDRHCLVTANRAHRRQRLFKRWGEDLFKSVSDHESLLQKNQYDDIIHNNGSVRSLSDQVQKLNISYKNNNF